MLELQNAILEMVARGETLPVVADQLCRRVEALAPDALCSVLEVDAAGILHPIASPSLPAHYSEALDGLMIGPLVGSCGSAAYLATPVAVLDIEHDPRWAEFASLALPLGLRACWSSPIIDGTGTVVGTFAFYYRDRRGPTANERLLVRTCVHLCSIAISHHRWKSEQKRRALQDDQTGLPNRSAFGAALASLPCDVPGSWALLVVDLDNLKIVNDTFGHQAGDHLIETAAKRIAGAVAPDKTYRVGGDEFVALVQAPAALADLKSAADAILSSLHIPADCGGHLVVPRATIGGALLATKGHGPERVRQNADFALYHAKETSRGGFVLYWDEIGSKITKRLEAIRRVDAALCDDRLLAHYQPVYRLDTREIVGFEALCRIREGDVLLPTQEFREAMTDLAVATALTERMLRRVAADMRAWDELGLAVGHVAINLCSADFQGGKLAQRLSAILTAEGVSPARLMLEVTEAVAMGSSRPIILAQAAMLREQGVRIALDGFGSEFASLVHLVKLPLDVLKIDRAFVHKLADDSVSRAIVEGLLHLARELKIEVIADGVETAEQASLLQAAGCRLAQGYLLAPPLDVAAATTLLANQARQWSVA
ncbi:bifunctional diguanylate cyclase/phosphodiesterase [Sphingomonas sp. LM7]|uniref:putative bifunctional diguanylate cyclase/phosphodiesterase n=1 Tax=Sphingomonas sp. LM7 TaxID=1938607 RepID=UPI000983D9F4|nr:EAL domain-containing protein [Sphingomonas sp. LM7]AQR72890.1 diguanylate cyclase [Sphingomonas sp. LM7]